MRGNGQIVCGLLCERDSHAVGVVIVHESEWVQRLSAEHQPQSNFEVSRPKQKN